MKTENWKPIPTWEGSYEASDLGRVRSLDRVTTFRGGAVRRASRGRVLSPLNHTGGYLRVCLWRDGVMYQRFIHDLVLCAFAGPRPPGAQGAHGDGSRDNNAASNLRWASPRENQADREAHGTSSRGRPRPVNSLNARLVAALRAEHESGSNITQLAKQFGLPRTTAADVVNRRTWK